MISGPKTSRTWARRSSQYSHKSQKSVSAGICAIIAICAIRFRHRLGRLPPRPSARPTGLATNIGCDLFVDKTVNDEILRVAANAPLTVIEVSTTRMSHSSRRDLGEP
jgi:hypothetical protein